MPPAKRGPYAGLTDEEIAEWRLILRFYDPISNGSRQEAWRDFKEKVEMQRRSRRRQPWLQWLAAQPETMTRAQLKAKIAVYEIAGQEGKKD